MLTMRIGVEVENGGMTFLPVWVSRDVFFLYSTVETPETFNELFTQCTLFLEPYKNLHHLDNKINYNINDTSLTENVYPTYVILLSLISLAFQFHHYGVRSVWYGRLFFGSVGTTYFGRQIGVAKSMRFLEKATRISWGIYSPSNEPQHLYYSGYRKHHCIHTQIVITSDLRICHVESGFMGHSNDAESFRMMTPIVVGRVLTFLRDCYLLGNSI
jgi:hypothetical protein